jgi:hypothetical protein
VAAAGDPVPFLLRAWRAFFAGAGAGAGEDAGADVEEFCASSSALSPPSSRGWEDAVLSERAAICSVMPSGLGSSGGVGVGAAGAAAWLVAVAVAAGAVVPSVTVADASALVLASMRGTSTKSAVSDRGELSKDEEEKTAEDDNDQTISSSSEKESLAHVVLDDSESMSSDEDREVVMVR